MINFDKTKVGVSSTPRNIKISFNLMRVSKWLFAGAIVSYFSGNGVGWIVLHAIFGWFYVVYKLAEKFFAV